MESLGDAVIPKKPHAKKVEVNQPTKIKDEDEDGFGWGFNYFMGGLACTVILFLLIDAFFVHYCLIKVIKKHS